ncbi:tetratricopeptide repeat protein [Pedobacter psychroterrae]|uniref:Tetratricopeptide repeat protein n=1 Tax=Pedobacter psychroterrae TaxID=2530453 RepID=A0A4R0NNN4_9SPHI|nr:tetratricopeptide repeat protein [Pedobacter psychroterrae]TCD02542.1 tetratricopeptide repeat protein [Pedobacter psychroterrae]
MKLSFCRLLLLIACCSSAYAQKVESDKFLQTDDLIKQKPDTAFRKIRAALTDAVNRKDQTAAAICYEQIGVLFYDQAAYSQALVNFYKANALLRKQNRTDLLAGNLNKIGKTYFYNRQYTTALKTFQEALSNYRKLNNLNGIADSYGFIGQTYEKRDDHKQAFRYQTLALAEFKKLDDQTGIAKIYENLGSIYEDRLVLDSALKYFRLALELNKTQKIPKIEIINNIGDVYRKTGRYKEAMPYSLKAAQMARDMNEQYQLASAYRDLSKTFYLEGRYDSAYHYSEAGRDIFLNIFSEDNKKQILLLQTLFEIEQKDNAIIQFEKDKKINTVLTIAAITITVLVLSLGASIISRQRLKIRNERKLNEQNNALYEVQKKAMEADLELKSKELTSHTLHLIQKNQLLEELKSRLSEMIKDDKRDQRKELKQVINLITFNNNQEKNWDDFRIVFERVHENFFESLKKHSKALTASELRLVALLKMNLSSADIATMLGISQDSLRISRYRLRKKLNLEEGENLSAFLQQL